MDYDTYEAEYIANCQPLYVVCTRRDPEAPMDWYRIYAPFYTQYGQDGHDEREMIDMTACVAHILGRTYHPDMGMVAYGNDPKKKAQYITDELETVLSLARGTVYIQELT